MQSQASFSATYLMDAQTIAWLEDMAKPLLETAEVPVNDTRIYLIKDKDVNAFVTARNDIFVNTGLILRAETPAEVQGVLAHEIAHIKARHVARTLSSQQQLSVPTIVGAVLGIGAAALGNPQAANALVISGAAAAKSNILKHTRSHERQADDIAVKLLNTNQISAKGLLTFFEKLRSDQLLYSTTPPKYLLTHPLPAERLDAIQNHLDHHESELENLSFGNINELKLIQAKLYAFGESGARVRRKFAFQDTPEAHLANIIAIALEGKITEALERLESKPEPFNPFYHELRAQLLLDLSLFDEARIAFKEAVSLRPTSPLLQIQYAQTLSLSKHYETAIELLIKLRTEHITWTSIHRNLAIAYGKVGKLTLSHASLAEEAYLKGNKDDIQTHLKIAQRHMDKASPAAKKRYELVKKELNKLTDNDNP